MEDEKKKKKPKKKKNKQTKTTESVSAGVGQPASVDHNHSNGNEQNHLSLDSETADVQNDGVQKMDVNSDRRQNTGTESLIIVDAEKLYWLDREGSLERKIKELQEELDAHIQKEADLETNILQLQTEKNSWFQKEADLEVKISELLTEKDFWLQKEAGYEGKINQLVDEAATLSSKGVSLEEKVKQLEREKVSWVQNENSTKEIIASLNNDNTRLQAQVMELEASRSDLFHQNQQLQENMSGLQSQIQNREINVAAHSSTGSKVHASENEDMSSQLEAARALVEKLLSENAELIEKVNDLYAELNRRGVTGEPSFSVGSDPMVGSSETAGVAESSALGTDPTVGSPKASSIAESSALSTDPIPSTTESPESVHVVVPTIESSMRTLSVERMESMEDDVIKPNKDGGNYMNAEDTDIIPNSRESIESEEIVQIPLDENEIMVTELEGSHNGEKADVPLTDAPLIGAPFRLVSFFARYVSGADLVNKSSLNSER